MKIKFANFELEANTKEAALVTGFATLTLCLAAGLTSQLIKRGDFPSILDKVVNPKPLLENHEMENNQIHIKR